MAATTTTDGQLTATVYGLIKNQNFKEAIDILLDKLNIYPRSRPALSLLGYCYYHLQQFEEAAECYEQLHLSYPDVEEYKLYYAQALYKCNCFQEATKASYLIENPNLSSNILKLQAAIKYNEGDFPASKTLVEQCPQSDVETQVNSACLMYREKEYEEALALFQRSMEVLGKQPDLAYNIALCYYRLSQESQAMKHLADIIETAIQQHPEFGIGLGTEGVEARSVGNTVMLHETCIIEAFNLKAAAFWKSKNKGQARASITDMPPRSDVEVDAVTLHNQALVAMETKATNGFEKLQFLLQQPCCPPETFANLLLLYCQYEYFDLAADVMAENAVLTYKLLSPFLYRFLETLLMQQTSMEEAFSRYEALGSELSDELRQYTKKVQECRASRDDEGARKAIQLYDDTMEKYLPVLMHQAKIYWEKQNYGALEKIFRRSVDKCNDQEAWKLNVAHTLFMQDNKYKEAINFYQPIVKKHYDELLGVSAIVLANLCVSYIMTSHNEEAEELMRRIEKEEEHAIFEDNDRKVYHLCIVNLVIGTLYCAKGNYEFGISRVMKSLEPYNRKLGTDTWFYAKRCFLSLMDSMAKQMVFLQDVIILEVINFLKTIELYGQNVKAVEVQPLDSPTMHEGKNTVTYEARYLRHLFLTLVDL